MGAFPAPRQFKPLFYLSIHKQELEPLNPNVDLVLSQVMSDPTRRLHDIITEIDGLSQADNKQQSDRDIIRDAAREVIKKIVTSPFKEAQDGSEPAPLLIDRLSFSWNMCTEAEKILKKTTPTKPKSTSSKSPTAKDQIKPIHKQLRSELEAQLLDFPVGPKLMRELLSRLNAGEQGEFLEHYRDFLKATKPRKLHFVIVRDDRSLHEANVSRLITWIIAKSKIKYVDTKEAETVTHMVFLTEKVQEQFYAWTGLKKDFGGSAQITDAVADEITKWLTYSCLEGDSLPASASEQEMLVKAFQKDNGLKELVHAPPPLADPIKDRQIADLESKLAKAYELIRTGEQDSADTNQQPDPKLASDGGKVEATAQAVRDLCKGIESKYPLEKLSDAQHSDDPMLSLKNVISHLFFVLRRQGLTAYPTEDIFELSYENSGLYECLGFEVPPGETRQAETVQRGWAIKMGDSILPIRRAKLRLSEQA